MIICIKDIGKPLVGFELKGKIIGLIGLGRVGSQVAKIAKAFGMQVMAWSENLDLNKCKELDVLPCSKEDLLKHLIIFQFMYKVESAIKIALLLKS